MVDSQDGWRRLRGTYEGSKVIAHYDSKVTQIERSEKGPYTEIVGGHVR